MKRTNFTVIVLLILAVAAGWKAWLVQLGSIPFNSDEAVVGLMARHILAGERPIFFYGQAYMGSLDAYLVAAGFAVFGAQIWVIRLVQGLLYLGVIFTTAELGRRALGSARTGWMAAALMAVPAVNVTLYTTASLGGYGEALLIGNLILLVGLAVIQQPGGVSRLSSRRGAGLLFLLGFLAGLGLWANGLTLVYSAPVGLAVLIALIREWKKLNTVQRAGWPLLAVAGALVGAMPWVIYAIGNSPQALIGELFGQAVAVEQSSWLLRSVRHLVSLILLGGSATFGFRPPWEVRWLGLPLIPLVLIFWLVCLGWMARATRKSAAHHTVWRLLGGVMLVLAAGFVFTAFGVDPSGRYFLPLTVPLALGAAETIQAVGRKPAWQVLILAVLVGYQGWGTLDCALRYPPGLTTQFYELTVIDHRQDEALMQFLQENGETRGYTNYWVAYPLAFRSQEQLIFTPRLPYHSDLRYTARDDRYAPYQKLVAQSERTAYITTRNPQLDERLRQGFAALGVHWRETTIGDYHVYDQLSRAVRPEELNLNPLPESTQP